MKVIFAYENKMKDSDEFIPNGVNDEQYNYRTSVHDVCWNNQFTKEYLDMICESQNIEVERMFVKDAVSSGEKFIIPLETQSNPYIWLGFDNSNGKELFSFFKEETLNALRSGQAKLLLHGATEGYDSTILNQVIVVLNLQCRK